MTGSNVNHTIIDFHPLVSQVLFGSFHISLPPTFSMKTPEATTKKKKDGNQKEEGKESGRKKKKGRSAKIESSSKMNSSRPRSACSSTKYGQLTLPTNTQTSNMCARWFLQKYCFNNCNQKESHMKADAIPSENLTPMMN
jgi:hypothetical protein